MILKDEIVKYLKGDQEAVEFILTIHSIAEIWDDLIDRDKPVDPEQINYAFMSALVKLPRNGFYQRNFQLLSPLVEISILDWLTANALEKTKKSQNIIIAYGLRFSALSLTTMAARIIGGVEWARQVNAEFRALGESWADYSLEHEVK